MTIPTDNFKKYLQSDAKLVETYIETEITKMQCVPERLKMAMRPATLEGGKRFRPFLTLECAAMFGTGREAALPVAAALECIHCYSLAHDDLPVMDNDKLRRGRPSVWAAFDEWTAILAGNALLTLAFEILAREALSSDSKLYNKLLLEISRAAGAAGMVGGQCLDLESDKLGEPTIVDINYIKRMQIMKTGALLRFACEAGAILASASDCDCKAMNKYGYYIGFAIQIADDLLDVESTTEQLGKTAGKDDKAGIATLVKALGGDRAREQLEQIRSTALALLKPYGTQAKLLKEATHFVTTRRS